MAEAQDPDLFHQQMIDEYKKQRAQRQFRTAEQRLTTSADQWRNRTLVQSKLPSPLYRVFYKFCQQHELSIASGIKVLLSTHPLLKND